jgi:putative transposase
MTASVLVGTVFSAARPLGFVTKYRHPVFTAAHLDRMEEVMRAVCRDVGAS